MRALVGAAVFLVLMDAHSVLAQRQAPPPGCIDPKHSPDYTPGVDARGKPVAPADVPTEGDVVISSQVFAEVRTKNPQVPKVGVVADLSGLKQLPPCPPAPKKPIVHEH
jgi:hypothetical protein